MDEPVEYISVEELKPGLRGINLKVKCASKNEEREVVARRTGETLRVTEALVGDESGSIFLTLWNDDIDKVEVGQNYKISNGYTTVFKTSLRLNIGKYGNLESSEDESPTEVNEDNNISDKEYEQQPRERRGYGGRPRGGGYGGGGYGGGGGGGRRPYGRNDRGGGDRGGNRGRGPSRRRY